MNELQAQLDEVNAKIAEEQAKGAQKDADILAGLEQKQADILLQMDAEKARLENEQAKLVKIHEQEVKVESDPIPIAVAGVDLSQLDPELIQLMELVTKADRRARLVEFNAEVESIQNDHKEQLRAASERELQWTRQSEKLQTDIREALDDVEKLGNHNDDLRNEISKLQFERDAALKVRDNTANELAGLQEAYNVSQEEIQQMRLASVFGEKKAQKIIDITPEETNKAQNLIDSLAKKFVSATPIAANWHEVTDEHGNKTIVHTDDLPKDQVLPFQGSQLDQAHVGSSPDIAAVTIQPVAEVTAPAVQFQGEVPMGPGLSSTNGIQTEAQTVTQEQIIVIHARLERLEKQANLPYQVAV